MSQDTPRAQTPPPQTADDRVTSLPGLGEPEGVQFAGYASIFGAANPNTITDGDEQLFYWFAGTDDYAGRPTVLWTNGGPGSSSFWGFFLENGPYEIGGTKEEPVLTPRPSAWNNHANYLIFEHPLSVTLSFVKDTAHLPQNARQGNRQLYQALLNFLARHPEIASNPLILAGESYAGTYLPLLAEAILEGNAARGGTRLDLKGVVLLDAWVNPPVQMAQDTNYAFSHGLISAREKAVLDETYAGANISQIDDAISDICGVYMTNIAQQADPPFDPVIDYLNRKDVRAALHVESKEKVEQSWSKAIGDLYASTVNDSYAGTVEGLLGRKLRVMVVSGLNDAKDCNFLGTAAWLELLQGDAAYAFKMAPTSRWQVGPAKQPQVLGFIQEGSLLSWVKVLNAGHMAVLDQPLLINLILEKLLGAKDGGR